MVPPGRIAREPSTWATGAKSLLTKSLLTKSLLKEDLMVSRLNEPDVVGEFETAWADPKHTRAIQPAIDINQVLRERYETDNPLTFTRAMLWDLEQRKAAAPGTYIPFVVRAGTDRSWSWPSSRQGGQILECCSQQRLWLRREDYGLVLERAHLDHKRQVVTFTGEPVLQDPDGQTLRTSTMQPRFHVEHGVGGTEETPLNIWRIVHLTDGQDQRLVELFSTIWESPCLPEFVEIYIRRDLHIGLTRK